MTTSEPTTENMNPASFEDRIWATLDRLSRQMAEDREQAAQDRERMAQERERMVQERERMVQERKRAAQERERRAQEYERVERERREREAEERKRKAEEYEREAEERKREAEEYERKAEERKRKAEERKRKAEERKREAEERKREAEEYKREEQERRERADREIARIRAIQKETAREMKETDRRLKKAEDLFTSQWGKLMESLVEGDLAPLLQERGIAVEGTTERTVKKRNGEHIEIDILAMNGADVVVVEVKTTLRPNDVGHFLEKLSRFADWFPEYRDRRVLGAVAYLRTDTSVVVHAERQGLFVIRATGSSASIVNAPDFEPRAFS